MVPGADIVPKSTGQRTKPGGSRILFRGFVGKVGGKDYIYLVTKNLLDYVSHVRILKFELNLCININFKKCAAP